MSEASNVSNDGDDVQLLPSRCFSSGRGNLQVTSVSLSDRAQRRLSKHAAAARAKRPLSSGPSLENDYVEVLCNPEASKRVLLHGRDNLQVTSVALSDRAQLRLSRHAAAARRGGSVNSNLLMDDDCTEVPILDPAASISSEEEDAVLATRGGRQSRRRLGDRLRSRYNDQPPSTPRLQEPLLHSRSYSSESASSTSVASLTSRSYSQDFTWESTAATGLDIVPAMEDLEAPTFYVEPFAGASPRSCSACHEFFLAGQIRLGLHLRLATTATAAAPHGILWVHAPRCFGRANFGLTLSEAIAFHPSFEDSVRARILEELAAVHARQTERVAWPGRGLMLRPLATQPWRYELSDDSWRTIVVDDRVVQADPETRPVLAALEARSNLHASFAARWAEIDARLEAAEARTDTTTATEEIWGAPPRGSESVHTGRRNHIDSLLAEIPVQTLTTNEAEPCVICCEKLLAGEESRRLPCLHIFHRACIDEWLTVKACCPLDKLDLKRMLAQQGNLGDLDTN